MQFQKIKKFVQMEDEKTEQIWIEIEQSWGRGF